MAEDELFPLSLYHGTSTWFLPDILRHGVGVLNVHESLRSRDFLREVWSLRLELADAQGRETLLQFPGSMIAHMIEDRVSDGGFNFRYGQFYCTADERKAVSYAANEFGSELISEAAKLLDEVRGISPDRSDNLISGYPEIRPCLAFNHEPIVIRLDGVAHWAVKKEDGEPLTSDIKPFARFLSFQLDIGAPYSSLSVFRAINIQRTDFGVEGYDLVSWEE